MTEKWQPIESAPKDGTRVIVAWPTGSAYITHMVGEASFVAFYGQWQRPMGCGIAIEPSHWMPLPSPPDSH